MRAGSFLRLRGGAAIPRTQQQVLAMKSKLQDDLEFENEDLVDQLRGLKKAYIDDMAAIRERYRKEIQYQKSLYLNAAWQKARAIKDQMQRDAWERSAKERRRRQDLARAAAIKSAKSANLDDYDPDGSNSRMLYRLACLRTAIKPSRLQELQIALRKWKCVDELKKNTLTAMASVIAFDPEDL